MDSKTIQETKEFWEPRYDRPLTDGEAEEIVGNVTALFDLLWEWGKKDSGARREDDSQT